VEIVGAGVDRAAVQAISGREPWHLLGILMRCTLLESSRLGPGSVRPQRDQLGSTDSLASGSIVMDIQHYSVVIQRKIACIL
jgi:hypothetical protein